MDTESSTQTKPLNFEIGTFIVARSQFGWSFGKIERTTTQYVYRSKPGGAHQWRTDKDDIVFCGDEATAKKLIAQLESSRAQMHQDHRAASLRMNERDEKFISAALAKASST